MERAEKLPSMPYLKKKRRKRHRCGDTSGDKHPHVVEGQKRRRRRSDPSADSGTKDHGNGSEATSDDSVTSEEVIDHRTIDLDAEASYRNMNGAHRRALLARLFAVANEDMEGIMVDFICYNNATGCNSKASFPSLKKFVQRFHNWPARRPGHLEVND